MDQSPTAASDPPPPGRPRAPGTVRAATLLLFLIAALALVPTAILVIFTIFQLSVNDTLSLPEIRDALPAPILAILAALLAVKLWTGRDWARQAALIVTILGVFAVFAFPGGLLSGPAVLIWVVALSLALLLTRPTARDWCDPEAPRHSPRIKPSPRPPFRVVAALLLLWLATGYALFLAIGALLSMSRDPDDFADPARTAWIMAGLAALALCHAALNVAFTRHRNWARLGTEALMAAYAIGLVAYAATAPVRDGEQSWALLLLLALVPVAFIWALRSHECKDWCGSNGDRGERHGHDEGHDEAGDGDRGGGGGGREDGSGRGNGEGPAA
jgi:uncharacterized membrane protein YgcG